MPVSFEPGQTVHIYRIVRQLGEGGMGAVYEAVQDPIGRRVALKILHSQYARDPAVMNRFFNEARAVNIVGHPGLVQVSDFGRTADGTAYLVMELLRGETLAERLRKHRRWPVADALHVLQQIASALADAHKHGIVHRDLKPSNVMLVPHPGLPNGEQVKIVDFGIAKLLDESLHQPGVGVRTETGKLLGTPQYMAPEQAKTSKVDGRADVYALGAMAFEMLAGRMPYQMDPDEPLLGLLIKKLADPPPDLKGIDSSIPDEIAQLVGSLMAKEPAERPTMAQLDSICCRLLGIDPQRRSGVHATVADEKLPTISGLVTIDAPAAVPPPPSLAPTVDAPAGAPLPNLPSPPRPISSPAQPRMDGAVAEKMPSVSTAPVRAAASASALAPAANPPAPTPATPSKIRTTWLVGILAVVVVEAVAMGLYLLPGRSDKRGNAHQDRRHASHDLALSVDLAAPVDLAVPVDLARSPDLALPSVRVRQTDAKEKAEAPLRGGHSSHCAPVTEPCIHGKNLSQAHRSHVLAALRESKLRLCDGERMLLGRGESGVRIVEAPDHLPAKLLKDFRLTLDGYLDTSPLSGEIEILCSAPTR